jgi:hypothetical protein
LHGASITLEEFNVPAFQVIRWLIAPALLAWWAVPDLGTTEFPPVETRLMGGELAFRQHSGGHTTGPNWPTFLNSAGRYITGPTPTAS